MSTNGSSSDYEKWKTEGWICAGDAVKELSSLQRGVSRQTLHNWRKAGKVDAQRILEGKREYYLFKREDLGLPPAENMPEAALNTLREMDIEFGARAEIVSEVMIEKLNPILENHTRQIVEGYERVNEPFLEAWRDLSDDVKRLADAQERIAEVLEKQEERGRRSFWRRWFD